MANGSLEIDHVLIAVADLEAAAWDIESRHGLSSVEGGRHPDWGTANRIIPLGESYLELVAVVDQAAAAGSAFGRWVAGADPPRGGPIGWAVRTNEIDGVARRLGLTIHAGSRVTASGDRLRWRSAGIERAAVEPSLPFFIEWEPTAPFPGRAGVSHRGGPVEIARLVLDGDVARLVAWLGNDGLPVEVRPGPPAVASLVLRGLSGEIVLGADRARP